MRRIRHLALFLVLALGIAGGVAGLSNSRVAPPIVLSDSRAASPATASPGVAEPVTLRVVTWNIADAYLFTGNRPERMRAIAARLRAADPDLVGLQEAFIAEDRALLWRELAGSRLRHEVRFPGATVGNGLWILSAHPIEEARFHRYESGGPWYRIWEGDWWAGKGVGLARVRLPGGGLVDFFDTHAQAGRGNPENETFRFGQMGELARFVRDARLRAGPALVVGDLNTRPGAPDYERAVREADLVRTMSLDSEIDHVFAVHDDRWRIEVQGTVELAGETPSARPEFFLSRAPSPAEWLQATLGPAGSTRLSDHPGYLVSLLLTPR